MELALARLRLALAAPESFVRGETTGSNGNFDTRRFKRIARVQHAIARAAHRVPWRSDCLVQALAAQHWLGRHGIPTALSLGVRKDMPTDFEAHAWLMAGDRIVTGGDIGSYTKLIGDGDRPSR